MLDCYLLVIEIIPRMNLFGLVYPVLCFQRVYVFLPPYPNPIPYLNPYPKSHPKPYSNGYPNAYPNPLKTDGSIWNVEKLSVNLPKNVSFCRGIQMTVTFESRSLISEGSTVD